MAKQNVSPIKDRLMAKVRRYGGCWLWTGAKITSGYGVMVVNRQKKYVHRLSYATFIGDIGDKLVCHSCDVPACINPKHLWIGTDRDNSIDRDTKGRVAHGSRQWKSKLTEKSCADMRRMARERGISTARLCSIFDVSERTVHRVLRCTTWKRSASLEDKEYAAKSAQFLVKNNPSLVRKIRSLSKRTTLTQRQIAKQCGVCQATVGNVLRSTKCQ